MRYLAVAILLAACDKSPACDKPPTCRETIEPLLHSTSSAQYCADGAKLSIEVFDDRSYLLCRCTGGDAAADMHVPDARQPAWR